MTTLHFNINPQTLKPRGELIADAIRSSILRGHFSPGEKLDQQDIANELAVSRIPVREALRTLDAEGLVTLIPNRGAIVTERTATELSELYFIRGLLEGIAAERAAVDIDDARVEKMGAIIAEADVTEGLEDLLALNNDFHMTLYSAYPQPKTIELIQQLRNTVAPYNRIYLDLAGSNKAAAWEDHQRIYEACLARDAQLANSETKRHLDSVLQAIIVAMTSS